MTQREPKIHYLLLGTSSAVCGQGRFPNSLPVKMGTTDREKVTCVSCKKLAKAQVAT